MVADRQTQTLPEHEPDFERFAAFAGFADEARLEAAVLATLLTVERHYAALFEREPDLGAGGSLVFTGIADDPATLQTLTGDGLQGGLGDLGPDPRLASRPHPRHAQHPGARAADRADAGAAERAAASSPIATGRSACSTSSSPGCRPACSCSRCSAPTRTCSGCWPT